MEKLICKQCGNELKKNGRKFCSNYCSCKYNNELTIKRFLENYNKNPNICLECNKKIVKKNNQAWSDVKRKLFCSHSCSAIYNNRKRGNKLANKKCLYCGKNLYGKKYCNIECQKKYNYENYIKRWKNGEENGLKGKGGISAYIRKYLFEKYNNSCIKCGWSEINSYTGKIPLTVEHIDGHWENNKEENLTLLCPNCHSLTSTYGFLNKGNGRPCRYKPSKV